MSDFPNPIHKYYSSYPHFPSLPAPADATSQSEWTPASLIHLPSIELPLRQPNLLIQQNGNAQILQMLSRATEQSREDYFYANPGAREFYSRSLSSPRAHAVETTFTQSPAALSPPSVEPTSMQQYLLQLQALGKQYEQAYHTARDAISRRLVAPSIGASGVGAVSSLSPTQHVADIPQPTPRHNLPSRTFTTTDGKEQTFLLTYMPHYHKGLRLCTHPIHYAQNSWSHWPGTGELMTVLSDRSEQSAGCWSTISPNQQDPEADLGAYQLTDYVWASEQPSLDTVLRQIRDAGLQSSVIPVPAKLANCTYGSRGAHSAKEMNAIWDGYAWLRVGPIDEKTVMCRRHMTQLAELPDPDWLRSDGA